MTFDQALIIGIAAPVIGGVIVLNIHYWWFDRKHEEWRLEFPFARFWSIKSITGETIKAGEAAMCRWRHGKWEYRRPTEDEEPGPI